MKTPEMVVPALGDDLPVFHQDTPNQRIGAYTATATFCDPQRLLHERLVLIGPTFTHVVRKGDGFMISCFPWSH